MLVAVTISKVKPPSNRVVFARSPASGVPIWIAACVNKAPRFLAGRRLGVDLANVKCSYLVDEGTESGSSDDTTLDVELPFPDGWIQVEKEADRTDDVFNFERSFVITDGNKTVAEGSVLIELYVGFVEADDDGGDDQVLLDDQSLTVVCL